MTPDEASSLVALEQSLHARFGRTLTRVQAAALGSVLGALVGDAAGGVLEFIGRKPTGDEAHRALMGMPGRGVFGLAPGQFTDDGELTAALLSALSDAAGEWHADRVAHAYCSWASSQPFDMGNATAAAFDRRSPGSMRGLANIVMARAAQANSGSKANGALMRISPLAVAGVCWSESVLAEVARRDASLSHPNHACQHANASYVLALRHLILHPGDAEGAFDVADRYLAVHPDAAEVYGWLGDAASGQLVAVHPQPGFVRHGFTRAFHHLVRRTPFSTALTTVLAEGGDTDTNACIVGAMLGALYGIHGVPIEVLLPVLTCDTRAGQERPPAFTIEKVCASLLALVQKIPSAPHAG